MRPRIIATAAFLGLVLLLLPLPAQAEVTLTGPDGPVAVGEEGDLVIGGFSGSLDDFAKTIAALKSSAKPATIIAAAAFNTTISFLAPVSAPERTSLTILALAWASPPLRESKSARLMP